MSNKNLKPRILNLREKGYTYSQIQNELNCSKSTISFHLGEGQKEKVLQRQKKHRKKNPLSVKISRFINTPEPKSEYTRNSVHPPEQRLSAKNPCRQKIKDFHRKIESGKILRSIDPISFKPNDLLSKSGSICYLTGRTIDLNDPSTYSLDHIKARANGGDNSLENCGVTCTIANYAKRDMTVEEFFQLCIDVVKHNKLKID